MLVEGKILLGTSPWPEMLIMKIYLLDSNSQNANPNNSADPADPDNEYMMLVIFSEYLLIVDLL